MGPGDVDILEFFKILVSAVRPSRGLSAKEGGEGTLQNLLTGTTIHYSYKTCGTGSSFGGQAGAMKTLVENYVSGIKNELELAYAKHKGRRTPRTDS